MIRRAISLHTFRRHLCSTSRSLTEFTTSLRSFELPISERDGKDSNKQLTIQGTWHGPGEEPSAPHLNDSLFTSTPPLTPDRPLALHALSLLREIKRLHPESTSRSITFARSSKWNFYIHIDDNKNIPPQYRYKFDLKFDHRLTKAQREAKLLRPPIHRFQFHGHINLSTFLALHVEAIEKLRDTVAQAAWETLKNAPKDCAIEHLDSEIVNISAATFSRDQHDLSLYDCLLVNHRTATSLSTIKRVHRAFFGHSEMHLTKMESLKAEGKSRFFVALGSNVGNRLDMIEKACLEMEKEGMEIKRTSGLWETKAMYVEDQPNFLNGVCEVISTDKNPEELLMKLKSIEERLGRVKLIEKGPRSIDLDVLLWNHEVFEKEGPELPISVPHKLMLEREFVLNPLCELIPNETPPFPFPPLIFKKHLERLRAKKQTTSMSTTVQLSPSLPSLSPRLPTRRTQIMSVLNVTPDSFSDGGVNNPAEFETLSSTITNHLASGASIIDIGGQTSRPGAVSITAEEEFNRILPAIHFLKEYEASNPSHGLAISIDTYRASVAKQAIAAGAHIINDISAGLLDPEMLPTVAKLGCTYIMMHMRGTPETMTSKENTTYDGDLIQIVGAELLARVQVAEAAGIRRWRMILDPGIGFAKNLQQNLELLRRLEELRQFPGLQRIPWLVGTSRKGFIGKITGVSEASQRMMGTAATMTAAVQGGADIVRVHDVKEMVEVVKMSDALYRGWSEEQT